MAGTGLDDILKIVLHIKIYEQIVDYFREMKVFVLNQSHHLHDVL